MGVGNYTEEAHLGGNRDPKSYNFPTSHQATRKTQTLTPTASNTGTTAPLISAS